jgi:lysozyme
MRTITPAARELLKHLEGEHGGKPSLIGYPDEAGVPTWGYGHTGPEVKVGVSITPDQAERDLNADLAEPCDCIEREVKVALNDNQFAALVIWLFNVGVDELSSSTLLRQLNKSNYAAVPDQIKRWDKVTDPITKKKKPSVGLQARRAAEVALWLTPVESGASDAPAATLAPQEQPQTRSTPVAPHRPAPSRPPLAPR